MSDETKDLSEVGPVVAKLWLKLAEHAARHAEACAAENAFTEASAAAKYAEAFYWRSTGDGDCFDLLNEKLP